MICSRCGQDNDDQALACRRCGHKLQSRRGGLPGEGESEGGGQPEFVPFPVLGQDGPSRLGGYFETAAYALCLLAGVAVSLIFGLHWPLYVLAVAVGLAAWLRRR